MSYVSTTELVNKLDEEERDYLEVFSEESMSVELARYPNPAPKTPHNEDELYFIVSGAGKIRVGEKTYSVTEGDAVYVEQGVEHDFFDIDDEITSLIVFAGTQDSVLGR
jgi:mannose-6-phosphate isomerase-like protein (cupin superfamily)